MQSESFYNRIEVGSTPESLSSQMCLSIFVYGKCNYSALTKWKYNFKKHYGTDENGNRFLSDIELVEEEVHPILAFNKAHFDMVANVESVMPVTNEIRPANVAVKFMIKAK